MYLHLQNQNNTYRQAGSVLIHLGKYTASQPIRLLTKRVEYKQYTIFIILVINCFHVYAGYLQLYT
jgi:hypothetical protein